MLLQETIEEWPSGANEWLVMTIHVTLIFFCILAVLFFVFRSRELKASSVVAICFLLIILGILGPETLLIYLFYTSNDVKLIVGIIFIIELTISLSILLFSIRLRNERVRRQNNKSLK
ncbi:MAG: hypothetical protein ACW97W_18435 [Candidatus Hodarchaeales archaeon]|jgi:hypothetical protein